MFFIEVNRYSYTDTTTIGRLNIDGKFFCYTLEDTTRGRNVKIQGKTAIPEGVYKVIITYSPKYKKDMPLIYNQNDLSLEADGISFTGLRMHGGNDHDDTEGCILVAKNYVNQNTIQGSQSEAITRKLKELGGEGYIKITNT